MICSAGTEIHVKERWHFMLISKSRTLKAALCNLHSSIQGSDMPYLKNSVRNFLAWSFQGDNKNMQSSVLQTLLCGAHPAL